MQRIVRVSEVRKQRLANAAADARRTLLSAEEEAAQAAARVDAAQATLAEAGTIMARNPASDQLRIWRDRCSTAKTDAIAERLDSDDACNIANAHLQQSLRAMHRQDLRHDHLADQASKLRRKLAEAKEARADDEIQGCGQPKATPLQQKGSQR